MSTRLFARLKPSLSVITATRDRPEMVMRVCFPSLLAQTHGDFEWIVVNDGAHQTTRAQMQGLRAPFPIRYLETDATGSRGLCDARNLGLTQARAPWISYLDDDNAYDPDFINTVLTFHRDHPMIKCTMPQQRRHRDLSDTGVVVRSTLTQVQPRSGMSVDALVMGGRNQIDANGLVHERHRQLRWNPQFHVFADYEFFLQCLSRWGTQSFTMIEKVLIEYFQRHDGIVGSSNYWQWEAELKRLWENRAAYPVLNALQAEAWLPVLIEHLSVKANMGAPIRGYERIA